MKKLLIYIFIAFSPSIICAQVPKNLKSVNSSKLIQQGIEQFKNQKWAEAEALYKSVPLGDTLYYTAQYELAYTYTMQQRYDEAMNLLETILKAEESRVGKILIYTLMANTYSQMDSLEKAIKMYDYALKSYPYHYNIHFNKGVVYGKMKNYEDMEVCSKMAIFCNPTHQTSHYQLGIAYLRQQCYIPGILALNYAVMLNPNSQVGLQCLQTLDELYAEGFDAFNEEENVTISEEIKAKNRKYQTLEQLLRNNFSMAKNFKLKTDINHIIVRQNQLIFDNLEYTPLSTEIEDQLYIPTFKMIMEDKKGFDIYSYLIFQGTNIDNNKVSEKAKKMEKDFSALYNKITVILKESIVKGLGMENKEGLSYTYYNDYNIESFGQYAVSAGGEKSFNGKWVIIAPQGNLDRTGTYKNGIFDGKWIYYDNRGNIIREANAKNNKANGEMYIYFPDDSTKLLNVKLSFINDTITGTRYEYNRAGILTEKSEWKDDYYNGLFQSYYFQGNLKDKIEYESGTIKGKSTGYFQNGKSLDYKMEPAEAKDWNTVTYYYPDGTVKMKGSFVDNMPVDTLFLYYSSGKISRIGKMDSQNKETGLWTEYYRNGNIASTCSYESGKKHGDEIFYSWDGRKTMKTIWKNGIITEAIIYNPDGTENEKTVPSNKRITLDYYFMDGNISYLYKRINSKNNGDIHGKYFVYAPDGTILEETDYKDHQKHGISKTYYPTGKLKAYCEYKNDMGDGMYLQYNENDTLIAEGYLKNDAPAYIYYKYHSNGVISERYLYNGTQSALTSFYYPNGLLSGEIIFKANWPAQINYYDHEGKLLGSNVYENGNGEHQTYYLNGKTSTKTNMKAGEFAGICTVYAFDGKELTSFNYIEGLIDGKMKAYSEIVPSYISFEGNYLFGNEYGVHKWKEFSTGEILEINFLNGLSEDTLKRYQENGKLNSTNNYASDVRDGVSTYFAADGKTVTYQLKHNNGQIYAYAYMDKNGKMSDFLPMEKEKVSIISYYMNGTKSCEITFEKYMRQGKEVEYYPNGKVFKEINNVNDQYNGEKAVWFENGKLKYKEHYINDNLHGKCEYYYENGKLKLTADYVDGFYHGAVELYNDAGGLIEKQNWFYNERIK